MKKTTVLAFVAATGFYLAYLNADKFMSVRQMLYTGYVQDPDYDGEIRGTSCGGCDDGVVRFSDVLTVIDLMSDENEKVRGVARWTLGSLVRYELFEQFKRYQPEEKTKLALKALGYYTAHHFKDREMDALMYMSVSGRYDVKEVRLESLKTAQKVFRHYCRDLWAERLEVKRIDNTWFQMQSVDGGQAFKTKADWTLHAEGLHRVSGEHEYIPLDCFAGREAVFELLDYNASSLAAVRRGDLVLLQELIQLRPETLAHIDRYRSQYLDASHRPYQQQTVEWLRQLLDNRVGSQGRYSEAGTK